MFSTTLDLNIIYIVYMLLLSEVLWKIKDKLEFKLNMSVYRIICFESISGYYVIRPDAFISLQNLQLSGT